MNTALLEILYKIPNAGSYGDGAGFSSLDTITIAKGFFFIFVKNGTALLSDTHRCYRLKKEELVIFTPSLTATLHEMSTDFEFSAIYLVPEYFDSLPGSQPLYGLLADFQRSNRLPIVQLKPEKSHYLQQTFALFTSELKGFKLYMNGIARHLCSLLLLQVADSFGQSNRHMPTYIKRSGEIFRRFRKLLMDNYKQHHDIGFYADEQNISTAYLSRIVKKTTGNTVRFHISELISADARRLLDCTDLDIKEIASQLGFSDQSVFGKFFVKKNGISPLKFRMRKNA